MAKDKIIVLASTNKGKVAEIIDLLKNFPVLIKTLDDFGPIPIVEEDGLTFEENAYKKASFTARVLGYPAIADDSGLVVPALGGAPGVYSARYAGSEATDLQRCKKLLREIKGHQDRSAYFKCVLSLAIPSGKAITYEGRSDGRISEKMIGENGFGYDPIFFCNRFKKTFAQLSTHEKNQVSHRGIAMKILKEEFRKVLTWFDFNEPIESRKMCYYDGFCN